VSATHQVDLPISIDLSVSALQLAREEAKRNGFGKLRKVVISPSDKEVARYILEHEHVSFTVSYSIGLDDWEAHFDEGVVRSYKRIS
jgi:hypothetical protein